jgi:3-hydroxyphenylacetate 6-hydroxylase
MAIGNLLHAAQVETIQHPLQSLAVALFIVPILYVLINEVVRQQARVSGLGGPKGFFLVGNLWQIRKNAAEKYRQWARMYGAVYQIQLGNIPVVVVNSAASAKVLFGQNAQALSSRPEFYTFHKVHYHLRDIMIECWFILMKDFRFYQIQQEQPSGHPPIATR